jgi:hypothetical protein
MKRRGVRGILVIAGLALTVVACGGASNGTTSQTATGSALPKECPYVAGGYLVTYERTSGTCPVTEPQRKARIEVVGRSEDAHCRIVDARAKPSGDGCAYEETQLCQYDSLAITTMTAMQIPKATDVLFGKMVVEVRERGESCIATGNVTYKKAVASY